MQEASGRISSHDASNDSRSNLSPSAATEHSTSQVTESSSPKVNESSATEVQDEGLDSVEQERLELYQSLLRLSEPDLKAVLYAVKAPPPVLLAPPGRRIHALLLWAKSPRGCGLDKLEAVIKAASNSPS